MTLVIVGLFSYTNVLQGSKIVCASYIFWKYNGSKDTIKLSILHYKVAVICF